MSRLPKYSYEFGPFRVDANERRLLREDRHLPLPPKIFDTLLALVSNSGHLLTKEELLQTVWQGAFVEENNLTQNISAIRRVIDDVSNGESYIETIPRIGYRFAPGVREVLDDGDEMVVENRTRLRVVVKEEESEEEDAETRRHGDAETRRSEDAPLVSVAPRNRVTMSLFGALPRLRVAVSLVAVAVAIGLAAVFIALLNRPGQREVSVAKPAAFKSVAVLPFKTIGGGAEDEYLGLGMTDTLIAKLSHVRQVEVRPFSAVHTLTGLGQDPIAVGRSLGVDAVLDGRIQRANGRVRVTVELFSVRDGTRLWTQTLDQESTSTFALQDAIAARIVSSLPAQLTQEESALVARHHTSSADAYEAYLKGRYCWNRRTRESFIQAVAYFQQAIALDSQYGLAYAGLADAYSFLNEKAQAKVAAQKALELDETLAEAHTSLANIYLFEWNWTEAERAFKRAVELDPNYATAHHWYSYYFAAQGNMAQALHEIRRARDLDPLSLIINTDLGQMLYYARRYDEAIAQLRKTIDMEPTFVMTHYHLALAYTQQGRYQDASEAVQRFVELSRGDGVLGVAGYLAAVSGRTDEALRIRKPLAGTALREPNLNWLAAIDLALGKREQA